MIRKIYLSLFLILSAIIVLNAQQVDSINSQKKLVSSPESVAYVVFHGDSLFTVNASLGPYKPADRAKSISDRLEKLANQIIFVRDSFNIAEVDNFSIISYKDFMIMSISDADVQTLGLPRQKVAEIYVQIIKSAFVKRLEDKSFTEWLVSIGLTILTLGGLFLIIFLINRIFKWINKKLIDYEKGLKRKRKSLFRYLAPKGPEYFFIFVSNILRFAIIILVLFLYLPLLFSFLPWTKGIVEQFYAYISDPVMYIVNGIINFLPDLFFIILIFIVARYIVRIITYVSGEIEQDKLKIKGFHKDWAKPTLNIVKIIVYAFALVFMFPHLPGSDSKAFQGVSIFLGVLFSLGSTSAISNIVAGIVITYMRPFMIGDRVKIGETVGDVVEKTLLVTKIRTTKNEDVTIPNATIINAHLWNYTKNASELGIILHPTVTIGYDVPSEIVVDLLLKAAKNTKNLTRDLKPFVLQKSLNDFYVEYELNVYTKQPGKMPLFYSELNQSIQREFNKAGVEILSPHYNAIRDGNASTIPGNEKPDVRNPVDQIIDKVKGKE